MGLAQVGDYEAIILAMELSPKRHSLLSRSNQVTIEDMKNFFRSALRVFTRTVLGAALLAVSLAFLLFVVLMIYLGMAWLFNTENLQTLFWWVISGMLLATVGITLKACHELGKDLIG